eukprot:3203521-Rhodomonas_salina.3
MSVGVTRDCACGMMMLQTGDHQHDVHADPRVRRVAVPAPRMGRLGCGSCERLHVRLLAPRRTQASSK